MIYLLALRKNAAKWLAGATVPVPVGTSVVAMNFRRLDNAASATLLIDGVEVGAVAIPFMMRIISSTGMSIGEDHLSPVSPEYQAPFRFEGTLHQVDIQLVTPPAKDSNDVAAREGMARQ